MWLSVFRRHKEAVWCALAGALLTFAYAPFSWWFLTPLLLLVVSSQLSKHQGSGFALGFAFGLGWFGAGISWVHVSIAQFGGMPLVVSIALMVILCAYLALYPALAFWLLKHSQRRWRHWYLLTPIIWLGTEWLRSWMLTGFPWLALGYSQMNSPLAGYAPLIGETGIGVLLVFWAVWVSVYWPKAKEAVLAVTAAALVLGLGLRTIDWVEPQQEPVDFALIQGNIKQALRWIPEQNRPTMEKYLTLTEPYWDADIVIWPEAAVPKIEPLAEDYLKLLDQRALENQTALITGIVNYNFETEAAHNSLIVLGQDQQTQQTQAYQYPSSNRYNKHHLLPIGEFIPFESIIRGIAPLFDLPMSSFSRGPYQQQNLLANGYRLAPAICFEIAFPHQVMANLHQNTDFVITVSNDAWFGHSHGPAQHLQIAQMRALELGIPVVRATNNGLTALIDHQGHIVKQIPQFEDAALRHSLSATRGATPYRLWGDVLILLVAFAAAIATVLLQRRQP